MSTKKLDILIVEDNLSFAIELEMLLEDLGYHTMGKVDNSAEALEVIFSKEPDLIFMDIDIKGGLSGIEIAQKIKHLNISILFITSYSDDLTYLEAQKSNMIGFLVKPVERLTLRSSIDLAIKNLAPKLREADVVTTDNQTPKDFLFKNFLFFRKKDEYRKVHIADILYFESDGNYINVFVKNAMLVTRMKLVNLLDLLPKNTFLQIHRSTVVNLRHIESYNFQTNKLFINGTTISVSRGKKDRLLELLPKLK